MALKDWSEIPGSNDTVTDGTYGNINWVEGQAANTVNNSARSQMAHVRNFYENIEWRDYGHTVVRVDNTNFEISGDYSADYVVGRRLKLTDSSTLYATITAVDYNSTKASYTTVTVTVDGGTALSASLSAAELGFDPTNSPIIKTGLRGCLVYRTTTQSIADSTNTDVGFPSEAYDTDDAHDVSSQNSRIVIPADVSVINVTASVNFSNNGTGRRSAQILLTGASLSPACQVKINSCSSTQSEILTLSTGDIQVPNPGTDYIELNVVQTSGGALDIGGSGELTWLCVNFK